LRARPSILDLGRCGAETERSNLVPPHDGPAKDAKLMVDVRHRSAVTPPTLARMRLVDAAPFRASPIHDNLYRGIAGERAP
jgi:hypothetical protein